MKSYWAGDKLVARRDGLGRLVGYHQDRLGSARLLTAGDVVRRFDFDAHGKPLSPLKDDNRRWHGHPFDTESGLVNMKSRLYDPELGRFLSADSVIPDPYRPQSLDRYAYTENDPVNFTDPSGHIKMEVEHRKEQAGQSPFVWMYNHALQSSCLFSYCPAGVGSGPPPTVEVLPGTTLPQVSCSKCRLIEDGLRLDPDLFAIILSAGQPSGEGLEASSAGSVENVPISATGHLEEEAAVAGDASEESSGNREWVDENGVLNEEIVVIGRPSECEAACRLAQSLFAPSTWQRRTTGVERFMIGVAGVYVAAPVAAIGGTAALAAAARAAYFGNRAIVIAALRTCSINPSLCTTLNTLAAAAVDAPISGGAVAGLGAAASAAAVRVAQNRAVGKAFESALAAAYRAAGFDVRTQVAFVTPAGRRFLDIGIYYKGQLVQLVEAKAGNARYPWLQELSDVWIYRTYGTGVDVVRTEALRK